MKLLVLSVLLAVASSANVPQKRAALYPGVYSLALPFVASPLLLPQRPNGRISQEDYISFQRNILKNDVNQYGVWLQYEPIPPLTAVVDIKSYGEGAEISGRLILMQPPGGPVIYSGNVTGLTEGAHGMHVHELGDLSKGCESIGEHFNPAYTHHGGPADPYRHVGDLGNVQAGSDGTAKISDSDHLISLTGPNSILGRGLAITANKDDYGRGGDKESLRTGNSGDIVACGVIVWGKPPLPSPPKEGPNPEGDAEVVVP